MPPPDTFRALDPGDFSFHGFNGLMADVEQRLGSVELRYGDPAVSIIENAIFVPTMKAPAPDRGPGRFVTEGGLVTFDGQPIDLALARRRSFRWGTQVRGGVTEQVAPEPQSQVDEEVIYLGWYFGHFGHFLMESLVRTWFLAEIDPSVKVVFHRKARLTPSGITGRILQEFGIPSDRILFLDQPTLLRRVFVPEPLYELSCAAHARMPAPFRQVAARIVDGGQVLDQPVYLSRRLLPSHLRQVVGEYELEEILRENGFRIAYPETMTFEDQVRLFNQHSDIFTSAGSAAYNVLFSLNRPTLHVLTCGIPREDFFLAPAVAEASSAYCNCFGRGSRPAINTTPLLAETPKLADYLDTGGFLKKPLRASLAGRGFGMRERFDEAWFYAMVRDVPQGEALVPDIERDALIRARDSWPLTWMLGHYHAGQDASRVDGLVEQFIDLVVTEPDISRLAQHHKDVEAMAARVVKHCSPETANRLSSVLSEWFHVDVAKRQRQGSKKAGRGSRQTRLPRDRDRPIRPQPSLGNPT